MSLIPAGGTAPPRRLPPLLYLAAATLTIVAVLVSCYLVYIVRSVLVTVFLGFFLAAGFEPLIRWMEGKGVRRGVGVTLFVLMITLLLVGFVALIVPPAIEQLTQIIKSLPQWFQDVTTRGPLARFLEGVRIQEQASQLAGRIPSVLGGSLTVVVGLLGSFVNGIFQTFTVLVLMVFFMLALPRIRDFWARVLHNRARYEVFEESLDKIGGFVSGQIVIVLIAGVTSYVFLRLIGAPYPEILAIAVLVLDLLPQVGAILASVLVTAVAFTESPKVGIATFVFFLVYQQIENYVLVPRVFAKAVNLSALGVFIAVLVGAGLAGVLGAVVALPITAAIKVILRYVLRDRIAELNGESAPHPEQAMATPVSESPHAGERSQLRGGEGAERGAAVPSDTARGGATRVDAPVRMPGTDPVHGEPHVTVPAHATGADPVHPDGRT